MRTRSKFTIFAAALVGMLLIPTVALAAPSDEFLQRYGPVGDDFITCTSDEASVTCTTGFFDEGTEVTWTASFNPVFDSGTATVDANGEADFDIDASSVPDDSEIFVTVEGIQNGAPKVLADDVAAVDEDGAIIANAGSDAALLALGAASAIALGGAALFVSRRKGTKTAA